MDGFTAPSSSMIGSERGLPRVAPLREIVSTEPATGIEVWRGPVGEVSELVHRARRAFPQWAALPLVNRVELLRRFANEVRKEAERLATIIARETGKPLRDARAEVESVVARVELAVRAHAERAPKRQLDSALQGRITLRHKPHGVLAAITPFAMPAQIPAGHLVPALLAGNAVILKPSEKTPATAEALVRCFHRAGIPASVVQLCVGGPDEGQTLTLDEGVDGVLFTGSAAVGIGINRRLAARPDKLVVLQMGGNNPLVVWDTPKLAEAAALVVQSAFAGAGQHCTTARRLIVRASLHDALLKEVTKLTDRLIVGAPFDDPAPFMGPLIDAEATTGLIDSFRYLAAHGGTAIRVPEQPRAGLPFLTPGIVDVTALADRPDVELFGPILQVIRVETAEEALREANATRFGLVSGLIGGSPELYEQFWAGGRTGIVTWNRATVGADDAGPAGGTGLSGNHHPGGTYAPDFCAYPVASGELDQPRGAITTGLR